VAIFEEQGRDDGNAKNLLVGNQQDPPEIGDEGFNVTHLDWIGDRSFSSWTRES